MSIVTNTLIVELSRKEVEELISKAIQSEFKREVTKIEFNVGRGGDRYGGYLAPFLSKVTVRMENKKS